MAKNTELENLRSQIDKIDNEIFELLQKRLELVGEVGEFKRNGDVDKFKTIIRPEREREMVLSVYQRALDEGFEKKIALGLANLWRNIIALSVNYEEDTRIAVVETHPECLSQAQQYFGFYSEFILCGSVSEALEKLISDEATIAIFPEGVNGGLKKLIENHNDSAAEKDKISIFVELPFFEVELHGATPQAICAAKVPG
jgi:chorismate mutase/prephenate dehydratase